MAGPPSYALLRTHSAIQRRLEMQRERKTTSYGESSDLECISLLLTRTTAPRNWQRTQHEREIEERTVSNRITIGTVLTSNIMEELTDETSNVPN